MQNILLKDNVLKIADFGLSRSFSVPLQSYTKEVLDSFPSFSIQISIFRL